MGKRVGHKRIDGQHFICIHRDGFTAYGWTVYTFRLVPKGIPGSHSQVTVAWRILIHVCRFRT